MADGSMPRVGRRPKGSQPALRRLDRLVGRWRVTGSLFRGFLDFSWTEGGSVLVQRVEGRAGGEKVQGVEYIGFDEETQTLRSRFWDARGSNSIYTWEVEGDTLRIWSGEKGSDNRFEGHFSPDGRSYSGGWQWPGGGYSVTATRVARPFVRRKVGKPAHPGPAPNRRSPRARLAVGGAPKRRRR